MPTETGDRAKVIAFFTLFFVIAFVSFSISLFEISAGIFVGLALFSLIQTKRFFYFKSVLAYLILSYFFWNLVSLTQSDHVQASLRGILKVAKHIFLCFAVYYVVDSEDKLKKVFQWLMIVALVIGLDALIQGATGLEFIRGRHMTPYWGQTSRWTGPFNHANDFSAYLCLMVLVFFGSFQNGSKLFGIKKYILFMIGLAIVVVCLAGTYSRGAWLSVAIAVVVLALFQKSKVLIGLIAGIVIAGALFSPPIIKARVSSLWDAKNGTIIERKELWRESLRMIRKSPWLGLGVNTYARNEPYFKSKTMYTDNQYAHNGYLQMAAEIGLLGLMSFLAIWISFFTTALPAYLRSGSLFLKTAGLALSSGILSFLIHSATDTDLQSLLLINALWLVLGIAWAAKRCSERT